MIKLHQAKLSDAFDVLHVLNTELEKKRAYGDNAWGDGLFTTSEILPLIEAGEMYIVIASDDVVGAVALLGSDEDIWVKDGKDNTALYIHKLASLQKGLGADMLAAAGLIAKKKNKTCLRLDCDFQNISLHDYYIEHGFRVVRRTIKSSLMKKDI